MLITCENKTDALALIAALRTWAWTRMDIGTSKDREQLRVELFVLDANIHAMAEPGKSPPPPYMETVKPSGDVL